MRRNWRLGRDWRVHSIKLGSGCLPLPCAEDCYELGSSESPARGMLSVGERVGWQRRRLDCKGLLQLFTIVYNKSHK